MPRSAGFALALSIALTLAGACRRGSKDAPPCAAVGAKFYRLATDALDKSPRGSQTDATLRRAVLDQIPAMRDAIVAVCSDGAWSAHVRACLVEANDHLAFEACEQQLTEDQRRVLDRSTRGESTDDASK